MIERSSTSPLGPGSQLGPYRIEALLGEGGMGRVFRALDTRLGRVVAIKLIRTDLAQRPDFRSRFDREARSISSLNHPHICSLYDVGEHGGAEYFVMEYVEGETLAAVLQNNLLPLDVSLRYAAEIADALAAAHRQGIVHRDLKPANIMIAKSGIKVLDFGLAKRSDQTVLSDQNTQTATDATRAGQILGTVAYMAPEQAEGAPADARSDVFSLGVVFYEMFCGRRPFQGNTTLSTLASILRDIPEPPRKIRRDIPERVEQVLSRCLEKKPEARYVSAQEVQQELAEYQNVKSAGTTVRRSAALAILLIALAAAAVLGFAYLQTSRARWAEREALPQITSLLEKNRLVSALPLYREAIQYAPASRGLIGLTETLYVQPATIETWDPLESTCRHASLSIL